MVAQLLVVQRQRGTNSQLTIAYVAARAHLDQIQCQVSSLKIETCGTFLFRSAS